MAKPGQRMSFPSGTDPAAYWESRARRYAAQGAGLAAVCSYGMPAFYNRAIHICQYRAMRPFLENIGGQSVLDVGCGVGRWSLWMADRGARVTGTDISPTMVREATRRAAAAGIADRCRFQVADLAELNLGEKYDLILGVTVLQHILEADRLESAVRNLKTHLAPGGQLILVESAPTKWISRCDTPVFRARSAAAYLLVFAKCGLRARVVTGIDPMPLKTLLLPYYSRLPKFLAVSVLAVATTISLPMDVHFGRRWVRASWHKLFALRHAHGD